MSTLLFANNANTTLAGSITNTATSLSVASGTGALFPAITGAQSFKLTLVDAATGNYTEIMLVTAISGDVMTVVRAQEGTTARAWVAGDLVGNFVTAGTMGNFVQAATVQSNTYNYANDTGSPNALVVTLNPAPASLGVLVGAPVWLKVANTSTGATTLNVNGTGAVPIVNPGGSPIAQDGLVAGQLIAVVYDGTSYQLVSRGPRTYPTVTAYASHGTYSYTVPAGVYFVRVRVIGAGAGGATAQPAGGNYLSGAGGGAGGYTEAVIATSPGAVLTIIIGQGGAGGNGTTYSGGNGGTSSVVVGSTTIVYATGGVGGNWASSNVSAGGAGGQGVGGNVNLQGSDGADGQYATNAFFPGSGAPGYLGMGAGRAGTPAGVAGSCAGAGGGGCYEAAGNGGNGADGLILVEA